ncbi:preprotein translocase subunit SecY [Candidatus Dojkabacteria bacterium]|nr:preprotein translocase subunit SecY [Candidatus Dojkabacteria bacterium]
MSKLDEFREKILSIFRNKEIRDKLWFSLLILLVFRIMAAIPIPGLPLDSLKKFFGGSDFGQVMSLVSGGVLENATLVAIGLGPYINASVIFQLLGSLIPQLEELQKEGARGRKIINTYTRILTVPLAILQSFIIYTILQRYGIIDKLEVLDLVNLISSLTAGALLMMWFGELISEQGLGGGSSFLIATGILAGIPGSLKTNFGSTTTNQIVVFIVSVLLVLVGVIFITEAERHINIQYARRVRSNGPVAESHIPMKLNQAGVMPVIFAMSLLSFPELLSQFLTGDNIPDWITNSLSWLVTQLDNPYVYNILLFSFIVAFSFAYTFVVFNPSDVAENLQKQAAFIPGIRPGDKTVKYLTTSATRLALLGSTFLALIAILPSIAKETGLVSSVIISGTGLLIVINTVLDVRRQINSMVVTRNYESYL